MNHDITYQQTLKTLYNNTLKTLLQTCKKIKNNLDQKLNTYFLT